MCINHENSIFSFVKVVHMLGEYDISRCSLKIESMYCTDWTLLANWMGSALSKKNGGGHPGHQWQTL